MSSYNMLMALTVTNYTQTQNEVNVTIQYAYLQPQQGEWTPPVPSAGANIPANGNPVTFNASNTVYPFGIDGYVLFQVGTLGQANVTFNYQLSSATALINGSSSTTIGTIPCSVTTDLNNNVFNVIVSIGSKVGSS